MDLFPFPYTLPAVFEADTVVVEPVTVSGERLSFYVDSAGGDWMYASVAADVGAEHVIPAVAGEWSSAPLPVFRDDAWIPAPSHDGTVSLNPDPPEPVGDRPGFGRSGLLGQRWHGGRVWEIDYPQKRFLLHAVPPAESWTTTAPLGFRERNGERLFHFPRVQVSVDGEILDVLFDTGAHTRLSSAAAAIGAAGSVIATSFIIETVAQRWRDRHPDWPVVQGGEAGSEATMIRAASVLIGGVDVGPVWFTQRADANFLEHMSQWMDKPVVGAIGGNAFHRLRLLVDYPGALLHLHEASHA